MQIKDLSFAPEIRETYARDYRQQEYKILTLGRRSYIAQAEMESTGVLAHVLIGNYSSIGHDVHFYINTQHDYGSVSTFPWSNPYNPVFAAPVAEKAKNQILIGSDVWIGRGAVILGGVRIGNGAVVAANAVVTKDVEPYAIVGGNPAKRIKYRFERGIRHKLQRIKWWYWPEEKIVAHQDRITGDVAAFVKAFYPQVIAAPGALPEELSKYTNSLDKSYFFLLDFAEKRPLWPHVVGAYLQNCRRDAKTVLFLGVEKRSGWEAQLAQLQAFIKERGGEVAPAIAFVDEPADLHRELLAGVDAFITSKAYKSLGYWDLAEDQAKEILAGPDDGLFAR